MTTVEDEDWGSATLYAGRRPVEPRMFTEADPIGAMTSVWSTGTAAEPRWSATTYVGRPRHRRRAERKKRADIETAVETELATSTAVGAEQDAVAEADAGTAVAEPGTAAGQLAGEQDVERSNRGLLAASGSMAVASLTSRITGFARSIVLVAALGAYGGVADSYNGGNTFPNMVYELLLGGVLSSVLIPLLVHAQETDDDEGVAYAQRLLSIAAAALAAMTLLAVLAAPLIAGAFAPPDQRDLTTIFATLLLPEIFFYGLGAMFMAVLNIRHVFKPGAWAPVLNNVIVIATVIVFWALPGPTTLNPATITTTQILVLGVGTTLGIAAQALVLVPSLRRAGFHWKWRFRALPSEVGRMREVGALAGWVLAYVVISQIGVAVIQKVGFSNGGLTIFTNVDLLFQVPYGILVVSLLTAIMPRLSRAAVRGDEDAVRDDLSLGARLSAVALVPITAGLIVLGVPLAISIFAYGKTDVAGAELMGSALAWSAFGLFPFAIVMLQLRVFYAMRDGKTPTLINAFMVAAKVALVLVSSAVFAAPPGTNVNVHPSVHAVQWLNISTSLSYVVGAVVGHIVLKRRLGHLGFRPVLVTTTQIGVASVVGGAAAYAVVVGLAHVFAGDRLSAIAGLIGGGIVGLAVFALVAWRMRIDDVQRVLATVRGG
ncbi:MAG TPA: murein biosynthesis integral membrane protein MurJ [Jatrophihabitans sp.]|nr:murein biosynthesis integral membrane protein MurJ [Jatrophihabitans sp.]